MAPYELYFHAGMFLLLLISCITDIRTMKIPNKVTFPAFLIGMVSLIGIGTPWKTITLRLILIFILFIAGMFLQKWIGLGDIKLFMVIILVCGGYHALMILCLAYAFFILITLGKEISDGKSIGIHIRNVRNFLLGRPMNLEHSRPYPFAPCLFLSYVTIFILFIVKGSM